MNQVLKHELQVLKTKLQQLATLGNGDRVGNSVGNVIAVEAISVLDNIQSLLQHPSSVGSLAINHRDNIAVDHEYCLQPMSTCPTGVKVQLLNPGGVLTYGVWDGKNNTWQGWAPLPKRQATSKMVKS